MRRLPVPIVTVAKGVEDVVFATMLHSAQMGLNQNQFLLKLMQGKRLLKNVLVPYITLPISRPIPIPMAT